MNDLEFELLIKKDTLEVPNIEFDSKKILHKCKLKAGKKKINLKLSFVLSSVIVVCVLVFIIALFTYNNLQRRINATNKIKITRNEAIELDLTLNDSAEIVIPAYGIDIGIVWDCSKHIKYEAWKAEFKNNGYGYTMRFGTFVNRSYYESIQDSFPNATAHSFVDAESFPLIFIHYTIVANGKSLEQEQIRFNNFIEFFYKSDDYKNLIKLAQEDYILDIAINEYEPVYFLEDG